MTFFFFTSKKAIATNFWISSAKISLFKTICGIDMNLTLVRTLHTHVCDSD